MCYLVGGAGGCVLTGAVEARGDGVQEGVLGGQEPLHHRHDDDPGEGGPLSTHCSHHHRGAQGVQRLRRDYCQEEEEEEEEEEEGGHTSKVHQQHQQQQQQHPPFLGSPAPCVGWRGRANATRFNQPKVSFSPGFQSTGGLE